MKARALLLAIAMLLLQPATAVVTVDQSGAFTTSAWGTCNDTGGDGCDLGTLLMPLDIAFTTLVGPGTGGVGVTSTMQTLTDVETSGTGTLIANATILGGLNTPLLGASATANDGRYGTTQALGAQLYTVTSGGPGQMINFSITLTGTVTNPDGGDATGLTATVATIIVDDDLDFILSLLPLALLGPSAVSLQATADGAVNMGPINSSITVSQGETFYMAALIGASAGTAVGGAANAATSLATLNIEFGAGSGNLSLGIIPVPASVFLLAPVVALLGLRRRSV